MSRLSQRKRTVIGIIAALALAGAAYAYWTAGGSGEGSGSAASGTAIWPQTRPRY